MSIDSGGIVSARSLCVAGGETVGSSFRILHAGSELISENLIQVDGASGGDSQLTVTSGGVVRYSGTERIDPRNPFAPPAGLQVGYSFSEVGAGVLTLSGAGSRVEGSAPLGVGRSGTGRLTVQSGGYLRSGASSIAPLLSTASGVVTVTGADSRWESGGDLSIGTGGSGELVVREGGEVSAPNVVLGKNFTGRGRVSVAGAGSTFSVMSGLQVGAIGTGTLEVLDGGSVTVGGAMSIGAHGVVSLTGGPLSAGSFTAAGQFQWNTRTFRITGSGGASLGTTLPSVLVLHDGMQLRVDHALSVGTGSVLVLGGGTASAGTFALAGGTIIAGASPFDLAGNQILRGQGTVVGRVTGSAGSHVIADGTLALGDATRADGFAYGGLLDVGSQQVILLASGKARPGAEVSLGEGGRLSAVNGMHLGAGDTLRFQGNASILGLFFNDGEVDGGSGRLSFLNDVSGDGSFGGDIVFHAGYSPGNSPAVVDFGDGNAIFDATAELTMEIGGSTPGTEYDQLVGIDQFVFNGTLQLVFGSNYAPITDDRLSLFSFRSFSGSFAPERIHVVGFDRSRLDFSRLASTGELAVSAPVPEPATYVLSFVGFGLLYWRARIRGSRPTTV